MEVARLQGVTEECAIETIVATSIDTLPPPKGDSL